MDVPHLQTYASGPSAGPGAAGRGSCFGRSADATHFAHSQCVRPSDGPTETTSRWPRPSAHFSRKGNAGAVRPASRPRVTRRGYGPGEVRTGGGGAAGHSAGVRCHFFVWGPGPPNHRTRPVPNGAERYLLSWAGLAHEHVDGTGAHFLRWPCPLPFAKGPVFTRPVPLPSLARITAATPRRDGHTVPAPAPEGAFVGRVCEVTGTPHLRTRFRVHGPGARSPLWYSGGGGAPH